MLFPILIVLYVVVCIALIVVVLLQSGKGSGLSGIFGSGGGGQTIFGARAGDIMTKSTTILAVCFMLFSLVLAFLSGQRTSSMTKEIEAAGLEMPDNRPDAQTGEETTTESEPPVEAPAAEAVEESSEPPVKMDSGE